mgnify:CR=1 FL=1
MTKFSLQLTAAAALAFSASGAMATSVNVVASTNGLYDIFSATFDGALSPCTGSSPSYCSFFGGDAPAGRNIVITPTPTGTNTGAPVSIGTTHTANGSFLDIALTSGNTVAQVVGTSTISLPPINLTISGSTFVAASNAGFAILPSGTAAINGSGQVEFLVNNAPGLAADFTTLADAVTSCTGPFCSLIPILSLDMIRYRLFLDYDPTFTSFTGNFIGQTANNSLVYATLNSAAAVPAPAAGWLLLTAVGGLAARRRKRAA